MPGRPTVIALSGPGPGGPLAAIGAVCGRFEVNFPFSGVGQALSRTPQRCSQISNIAVQHLHRGAFWLNYMQRLSLA